MKKIVNHEVEKYNTNIIIGLFMLLVFVGKIIRYTLMKKVLVDFGIGHSFITPILHSNITFKFFDTDSMSGNTGGNTLFFYKLINIFKLNSYTSWEIYISIIWNFILLFILLGMKKKLNLRQFIFVILSVIVLNIFDFTLAKEPIQMLYFIGIYLVLSSNIKNYKIKYIYSVLIIFLSAITFRTYYFLIIVFMVFIQALIKCFIINRKKVEKKHIILMLCAVVLFYFTFLNIMKIVRVNEYSELIRVRTRHVKATTDINNLISGSGLIIFTINYLIIVVRMLFPLELITMGVKYIPYVVYQCVITYFIIRAIINIKRNSREKNIALYIYLGFLFASATFEPDFGSWIRHEAVLFPVISMIVDIKRKEEKVNDFNNNSGI